VTWDGRWLALEVIHTHVRQQIGQDYPGRVGKIPKVLSSIEKGGRYDGRVE